MAPAEPREQITISDDEDVFTRRINDDSESGVNKRQRVTVNKFGVKRRREDDEANSLPNNPPKKQRLVFDGRPAGLSSVNTSPRSLGAFAKAGIPKSTPNSGAAKLGVNGQASRASNVDVIDLTGSKHEGGRDRDGANTHSSASANLASRRYASSANADIAGKDPRNRTQESATLSDSGALSNGRSVVQVMNPIPNSKRPIRHVKTGISDPDNVPRGSANSDIVESDSPSNDAQTARNIGDTDSQDELSRTVSKDMSQTKGSGDSVGFGRLQALLSKRTDRSKEAIFASVTRPPSAPVELQQEQNSSGFNGNAGFGLGPRSAVKPSGSSKSTVRTSSRGIERAKSERVHERRLGNATPGELLTDHAKSKAQFNQELQQKKSRAAQSDYTVDLAAQISREVEEQLRALDEAISYGYNRNNITRDVPAKNEPSPPMTGHIDSAEVVDGPKKSPNSGCTVKMPSTDGLVSLSSDDVSVVTHAPETDANENVEAQENDSCRQTSVRNPPQRVLSRPKFSGDQDSHKHSTPEAWTMPDRVETNKLIKLGAQGAGLEAGRRPTSHNGAADGDLVGQPSSSPVKEPAAREIRASSQPLSIRPIAKVSARIHDPAYSDLSVSGCIERIFGACMEEFREDNDYWVRTWFRRARHSSEQATKSSEAASGGRPTSVFSSMKPRRIVFAEPERPSEEVVELKLEPFRSHNKQGKKFWMIQSDRISGNTQDLPNYSHYVSIKGNILAPNDKVMHHWPYISEDPPEGIDSRFHEQYFIDKEDRQRKLRRMLQAETIAEYVERTLQDIECEWCDVLRFLLEANPSVGSDPDALKAKAARHTFCEEDFSRNALRWVEVLDELPASKPDRLGRAALLCDCFQKATKFSIWHIARRSDYVKARLPDIKSVQPQGNVTCRVCMRFSCPYHGEIREKDDRRNDNGLAVGDTFSDLRSSIREDGSDRVSPAEASVHTDIINPPQVNFRQAVCFPPNDTERQQRTVTAKDRRSLHYWQTEFPNYLPEDRGPYYPCNHPGVSCKTAECSCFRSKVPCEKSCACAADCPRKFQGCSCATEKMKKGQKLVCFEDERCLCYQLGRECDADLCGSCGVSHVLDPVHRYEDRRPGELCNNASLQRGVRKHTVLGESGVHGLGLYACEDIRENEYVDEYLGEIITINEGERRGAVYEYQKLSYLFSLNKDQDIDGTCFGNKARFINHAGKNKANLYARTRLVNTVYRIGLYATRNIKKGEELFFEYGDKFPDQQLEGPKAFAEKSAAPHVRNTRLVRDEFYDVEQTVDEVGNRRVRKVTGTKPARGGAARNRRRNVPASTRPPHTLTSTSSSSSLPREKPPKPARGRLAPVPTAAKTRTPSEPGRGEFFDPAERLETYYVSAEGVEADVEAGAETSDFRPDEGDGDDDDDDDDDEGYREEAGGEAASEPESEDEMPRRPGARRTRGRARWRGRR